MAVLIIVEHNNKRLDSATANMVAAGLAFAQEISLLVVGFDCQAVAAEARLLAGVSKVLLADDCCYEHFLAENTSELIVGLAAAFSVILAPASTFGKNLLPRVAAKLNVGQISDVTNIITNDLFEHPIYAGNALETVTALDNIKVLTIRTTSFDTARSKQQPCDLVKIDTKISTTTKFIAQELHASSRPDLTSAAVIVAGGRGLQSREKFKLIYELADALNAAVGASRAAVDAGFMPNDYQIGQTGKIVAPLLYFAIGISGAIQHVAGMKDAKIIVAINKDEEAPIFQIANYGLVGDLFVLLPELIKELAVRTQ